ncbi:PEP-CTERM sorting domain-containing protein [Glaciecola sp. MF2-115]|uniref:PEP-CTERM sorting domain-containing protein n=1 Tax=Glaciecola sp. MF2-115 TaxID=3384827 RepID=UPI0039A35891
MKYKLSRVLSTFVLITGCANVGAAEIFWTDWLGSDTDPSTGFESSGTITTNTSVINVTYTNANGISFYQSSGGTDYWQNARSGRNAANSPYTSAEVDNIPTGTDIIALRYAGNQTLVFSEAIANPVFSYVSLNGNGYAFDQDFDILSVGGVDGNSSGYWGSGTSFKETVDVGNGVLEYRLLGTGEPHGTLQFKGAFDTVTWRSLSNENWNGFTVGVVGTAAEVFPNDIPAPGVLLLMGLGFAGVRLARKTK